MANWRLHKPPTVKQGTGYKCWAAAMESWLAVTPGRPKSTQEQLLEWSKLWRAMYDDKLPEYALSAKLYKKMAVDPLLGWSMQWTEIPRGTSLADDTLYKLLGDWGFVFMVYTVANSEHNNDGGIRHAVVVWAANDQGGLAIMNPATGSYQNKMSEDVVAPILIGYRTPDLTNWF